MNYVLHLLIYFEIYIVVAMSLNLLIGYSGLLQVAHAAYFGIGAYAAALLSLKFGISFLPSLVCAGVVAASFSLCISLPAWRFKSDYFVMISIAVQVALYAMMDNWVGLTNGPYGLFGIPKPTLFGNTFTTTVAVFVFYAAIVVVLTSILWLIKQSPYGRSLQAMRDDELSARSIGISVRRLKVESFLLASAMVGIAGGMYGAYVSYIDPTSFNLNESILMLSMVIVGGTGNVLGPMVGAAVLIGLPELLRFLDIPDAIAPNIRLLVYGLLLILMMHWRPQGLAGKYRFE